MGGAAMGGCKPRRCRLDGADGSVVRQASTVMAAMPGFVKSIPALNLTRDCEPSAQKFWQGAF